jgi:hypothetical protein
MDVLSSVLRMIYFVGHYTLRNLLFFFFFFFCDRVHVHAETRDVICRNTVHLH